MFRVKADGCRGPTDTAIEATVTEDYGVHEPEAAPGGGPNLQAASMPSGHHEQETGEHGHSLGSRLPLWSVIPFVGILLSIAIFPLAAPSFWHHHFGKVSAL